MRGKKLGRFLGALVAVALAVGATSQAAFAGGAHSQKTPPDVPGFNGSTIKLGAITPQSGIASVVGKPLTEGNRVYWEGKNAKGGVAGKYKVELSIEDSQYQVETALQSYDKIKGDVVAFQQILGTQIVKSVLSRLKAENGYGGPASLEGVWVKDANLMPTGTPYQVLAANGLDWYQKNGGQGKKVCAMAQDDAYGASGLDGLTQAAKTLKVKVAKTVRYATGSDTSAQVGELADANCDAVVLVSLPNDTGSIVTKMVGRNFTPQVLGIAPSWLSGLENTGQRCLLPGALRLARLRPGVGRRERPRNGADDPGSAAVRPGPEAGHVLRLRVRPGVGDGPDPGAGRQERGPQQGWDQEGEQPGRDARSSKGSAATTGTASRRATATRRVTRRSRGSSVGQPVGLQVVEAGYTSQAGKNVKFTK